MRCFNPLTQIESGDSTPSTGKTVEDGVTLPLNYNNMVLNFHDERWGWSNCPYNMALYECTPKDNKSGIEYINIRKFYILRDADGHRRFIDPVLGAILFKEAAPDEDHVNIYEAYERFPTKNVRSEYSHYNDSHSTLCKIRQIMVNVVDIVY